MNEINELKIKYIIHVTNAIVARKYEVICFYVSLVKI